MKAPLETLRSCEFGNSQKAGLPPSSSSFDADGKPKQPKKKRVRREKIELDSLRLESRKLQTELAQLREIYKHQQDTRVEYDLGDVSTKASIIPFSSAKQHYRLIVPRKKDNGFVWQRIAERQLKERWRAQNQNQELRERLLAEYEVGMQLTALLHRQSNVKIYSINRRCNIPLNNDDAIVKSHLAQAENALAEMQMVLRGPAYRDATACFVHAQMKKYGGMDAFIMESNTTLPFPARVTGNALWRVMGTERLENQCYDHRGKFKKNY
ncbi:uncharacterized protein IUM83_03442 [Phytophthora cinnamomi]|uniref:uncharacterized protein n=1 Tax=Phytophthora cinnamomi TaxID=4785 RepID=UPI00355A11AD|nr:hypothetical protein IUM83_03442 [Phytophthora cinnamomi]